MHNREERKISIAFIHPDLGIGGAERLVIDAALGLKGSGHDVTIYTSHCDKEHCFDEVKRGEVDVVVIGDFLPVTLLGKFYIVFATLRQLVLVITMLLTGRLNKYDLFIIDQLSTSIPLIRVFARSARTLFYCHFPDQLLARKDSLVRKFYRMPIDLVEEFTMSTSDFIAVNSYFTRTMFLKVFKHITMHPAVIHPCVDLTPCKVADEDVELFAKFMKPSQSFYLSINRYEKKKDVGLAIEAFQKSSHTAKNNVKLVICGGYDERVLENAMYLNELQDLATKLDIDHATISYPSYMAAKDVCNLPKDIKDKKLIFLTSVSNSMREYLLQKTELLLYTPSHEHFGIVPLEAMKNGKPVLAINNGGPLETVIAFKPGVNDDEATGWLRDRDVQQWADAMDEAAAYLEKHPGAFKSRNFEHINSKFSREAMTDSFLIAVENAFTSQRNTQMWNMAVIVLFCVLVHFTIHLFFA